VNLRNKLHIRSPSSTVKDKDQVQERRKSEEKDRKRRSMRRSASEVLKGVKGIFGKERR